MQTKKLTDYKILVVDDSLSTLDIFRRYFEFYGFTVSAVQKGQEALDYIKETKPDLIILDVMLPDIDGFEVAQEINKIDQLIPIIMLTAKVDHKDKLRGLMSGAHRYLTKPCSPNKVLDEIKKLLNISEELLDALMSEGEKQESISDTVELPPYE